MVGRHPTSAQRIASLETLRFVAAIGVVQFHIWRNHFGVAIGHPGTDVFLCLVGFVSAIVEAKHIPAGNWVAYVSRRFVRLYVAYVPLYFVVLWTKREAASLDWAMRSFLFLPIDNADPVIGATWMISMFVLFYAVFSLTFVARSEAILWPAFVVWASAIVAHTWLGWSPRVPPEWGRMLFDERNLEMMMGYLAGVVYRRRGISDWSAQVILMIGAAGVLVGTAALNVGGPALGRSAYVGMPVALVVLGAACVERSTPSHRLVRVITSPALPWLGSASYVLYLSHGLFIAAWSRVLPVTPSLTPIITLGSLLVAIVGYELWEKPVLSYLRTGTLTWPLRSPRP